METASRRRAVVGAAACGVAFVVCIALVSWIQASADASDRSIALFEDITGGQARIVDPALMRLSNDPWFTGITDTTLTEAAKQVAQDRLEQVILARVHRMSAGNPNADLDKLTRVAEEQVIYDHWILSRVQEEVERRISPVPHHRALPAVRELEEKLRAKMMQSLLKEAVREINLLVDATDESPKVKKMAKDHLLERTTDMLQPQVMGRIDRFVSSRVAAAAKHGVEAVLKYLAHAVNEEEKRELLGGPLVDGVDYSFEHEKDGQEHEAATSEAVATSKTVLAPKALLRKSMMADAASGAAVAAAGGAASATSSEASSGGVTAATAQPKAAAVVEKDEDEGDSVNVGLVIFVFALLAVIGLLALL